MNKRTENLIARIYNAVFNKVYKRSNIVALSRGDRSAILSTIALINTSKDYDKFAKKFALLLAKRGIGYEKGLWRKYFFAAKKLGYIALDTTWSKFEYEQMKKAIQHNFKMIKTIPDYTKEIMEHKYTSTLIEEVAKGNLSRGSFRRELEKHGHKNAKVIARTESAKLQTAIVENRAKDLGSIAYRWLSSNDKRTRPSHRMMNDVVVFWRNTDLEKPLLDGMYGHAGEFPNCRCSPRPIFDEDDLTKNSYKVYDYRSHKIITMTKNDLLKSLEKGEL